MVLIFLLFAIAKSEYVLCKPLRKQGFKYKRESKSDTVLLIKENTIIKFAYEIYQISFDSGRTFINIVDSPLGTLEEKKPKWRNISASPLDKQRGDIADPMRDFVAFLNKYL